MAGKLNIYEFLEEYHKYSCLWLKCSPEFKNRNKRDAAEEALLKVTGLESIKALRAKIRSIRGTYNQEKAKIKSSTGTGSGRSDVYKPRLIWYEFADSFLKQNDDKTDSFSNLEITEAENVEIRFSETPNNIEQCSNTKLPVCADDSEAPVTGLFPVRKKRKVGSQKPNLGDSLENAVQVLKQVTKRSEQSNNEFTHFGLHVASQLHAIPLKEALELQTDIQAMITSVRSKQLSQPSPSPSSSYTNECMQYTDQIEIAVEETQSEGASNICTYFTNYTEIEDLTE